MVTIPSVRFTGIFGGSGFLSGTQEIDNLAKLANYLVSAGFTQQAAAGVASVVAGESTGNPDIQGSGGAGLIGWTPPSTMTQYGATFTGNPDFDMSTQAAALIRYGQGRGNVNQIAAMTNATQAAQAWSRDEAPAVPGSDIRAALIPQILAAMSGQQVSTTPGTNTGGASGINAIPTGGLKWYDLFGPVSFLAGLPKDISGQASTIGDIGQGIYDLVKEIGHIGTWFSWLFAPSHWLRIGAALVGTLAAIVGFWMLSKAMNVNPGLGGMPIPIPV